LRPAGVTPPSFPAQGFFVDRSYANPRKRATHLVFRRKKGKFLFPLRQPASTAVFEWNANVASERSDDGTPRKKIRVDAIFAYSTIKIKDR
jgi:uncharacterized protein YjbK